MSRSKLILALLFLVAAPPLAAQRKPTSAEAQVIAQDPAMMARLRQRILSSGLTPDQVRARLRAEGYPENLLDAYLPSAGATNDSTANPDSAFNAISELGMADTLDVDQQKLDSLRDSLTGKTMVADSGYTIFGLSFFRTTTSQFDANLSGPVDPGYRVGPGDRLVLVLTGDVEQSYTLDVTREGFVIIPQVGQVWVNNLTLRELETVLFARLRRVYSGVRAGPGATTRFYITPARLRSNQIFILGDVERPGSYRVSSAGTALTGLYAAQGPTKNGSFRRIEIKRGGKTVDVLDMYDYLLAGDATHDVRLQNGDVIFVPTHLPRVRIVGEVARPATYEIKPDETLADALRFAGNFTATAARLRVQIERIVPPAQRQANGRDRIVTEVISDQFTAANGPRIKLEPGDLIRVFPVASRLRNRVIVKGNVWSPTTLGMTPNMRISDALRLAGGVKSDSYLSQVLVTRLQPDMTQVQLRAALRDTTGAVINDFPLQEDDEIQVFSVSEFRTTRDVTIGGAVRRSGRFPFREGMTMRDLVLLSGGLQESAYLREAELARLPEDRSKGTTAVSYRVPLDSSYLFERSPDGKYLGPPGLPASTGPTPDVVLKPYDNVLILRQPGWELQRTVKLTGEVRFPGEYALQSKTDKLTDVIRRAGGLTAEAYPDGVNFYREQDSTGRIGIDLPGVLRNSRNTDNLILQDKDRIFVPRLNSVVTVRGAVNSPVTVTYNGGSDIDYYINAAGGPSRNADTRRAYVTQGNGKVQARRALSAAVRPQPGSIVTVPEKDPLDLGFLGEISRSTTAIVQILATVATIIAVVRR